MNGKAHSKFEIRTSSSTGSGHPNEAERKLFAHSSKSGCDFEFVLKGSHINVMPVTKYTGPNLFDERTHVEAPLIEDWYEAFTEHERARIMQAILVNYRIVSKKNNITVAAVGVVDNPDPYADESKKHLLYVGRNTNIGAAEIYKSCAEQNMIRAAENSFEGYMNDRHMDMPEEPYLREVYVMGGKLPDAKKEGDKGLHAVCPCGMCTDILATKMVKGGRVYVFPHNNKIMEYPVDSHSLDFRDVKPGHIWKTTIENLNRHRHIKLDADIASIQRGGVIEMAKSLLHELIEEENPNYVRPVPPDTDRKRNDENYIAGYNSIPELDNGSHNGTIQSTKINEYLRRQIKDTLKDRIYRDHVPHNYKDVLAWMKNTVRSVHCSVIQTDDNRYYVGYDSKTGRDNAYVSPAFSAVGAAVPRLGTQGIKNLWTMEYNPEAIEHNMLNTPNKDDLERLMKRQSKEQDSIRVNVIPFNGLMAQNRSKLAGMIKRFEFTTHALCPGGFMGENRQVAARHGGGDNGAIRPDFKEHYKQPSRQSTFVERILSASDSASRDPDFT